MDKVIKLYKGDGVPFPSVEEQIVTSDFVYTAKRMGGAPSITCTVRFKDALDDSLDDTVYTVFNNEKYYLRRKPTTSQSNTDVRYKYDIEFISERVILDNVYFLDVVNDPMYKGTSNSTKFTFYGHIGQFAERLNYSLQYSHLDYVVVVDEGVTSEEKNLSFTDQFFSNVLQEIYNTYELPYYFEGKEIHIGTSPMDKHLANIFEYGADKNLLSITKQSANNKIVNRITGTGSSENIPYYYPNSTPLGEVEIFVRPNGTDLDERNFKISNPELIASRLGLNETVKYTNNLPTKLLSLDAFYRITEDGNWIGAIKEEVQENVFDYWRFHGENIKGEKEKESTKYRIKFVGTTSGATMNHLSMTWNPDKDYNPFKYADNHTDFNFRLFEEFKAYEKNDKGELQAITATIDGDKSRLIKLPFNGYSENGEHKFEIQIEYTHWGMPSYYGMRWTDFTNIGIHEGEETTYYWVKESGIRAIDIEYFGLETDGEDVTDQWVGVEVGVKQKLDEKGKPKYITPSPNLMPSIYRNSWGVERFYNATNETFKNENGEYYVFTNPYVQGLPKEHIEPFDDIKPTINGITNAAGQPFNQFLDIAFDKDDNDSLNENNELVHPYFYVKLPKYNGEYGFNLFDCLNEKGEMTFSMTSGQLGACNFKIAVDKNTNKNDIQVDESGNLVYNEDGRVAIGSPQQRQNDTSANEVWIALFKDIDTYPSVMPNDGESNKPSPKDTFVILNITFPEQYIRAAEERLDNALIQFMYDNNVHKFNFSVSLSRIYFEENPEILGKLSENSSVLLTYQEHDYRLFVSSFTYKMSSSSILPEISVELADTLSVSHSAADNIINAVKMNIASTISSLDVVGMVSQSFLRKGTDDQAQGRITFNKGLTSHGSVSVGTFIPETSGVGIYQDENGNWHFETDYMRVRKKLSATSVEIEEAHHVGGQQLLTSANAAIDYMVERDTFYRCYFLKQDSTGKIVYNKWKVQDQAYCRFFNIDEGDEIEDHYYWRKVVSTSNETKDDTVSFEYDGTVVITSNYHFVDLSKTECDVESDVPRVSDNIVQLGYQGTDDASRQNAIVLAGAGEGSPYIRQYVGINSFKLPEPDTQIKPGDNVLSGTTKFKTYKDEDKQLNDLDKEIESTSNAINNLETGTNILRNSGFNGDYDVIDLDGDGVLNADETDLFSPSLKYWDAEHVKAEKSDESASGKCVVSQRRGTIKQILDVPLEKGANYIFSFKGKGTQVSVKLGEDVKEDITLNSTIGYYEYKFEAKDNHKYISISMGATTTLFELSLIRGTISNKTWAANPLDNRKERAEYESLSYVQNLLKANTVIDGGKVSTGVVNTGLINMGNYDTEGNFVEVTAGMSGTYNNEHSVAFFGGGDLAKAIYTVAKYRDNPNYEPTTEELASMAKAVITHGGRAILQDIILRGYVYAEGGVFRGKVYAEGGEFKGKVIATDGEFNGTVYASNGEFNGTVYATDGAFTGIVNAVGGSFDGDIDLKGIITAYGTGNNRFDSIRIDGVNRKLEITGPSKVDDWGVPLSDAVSKTYVSLSLGDVILVDNEPYVSADIVFGDPYTMGASVGTQGFQFKGKGLQPWADGSFSAVTNAIYIDGTVSQFQGMIRCLDLPTKDDKDKLPSGFIYRDGDTLKIK